MPGKYTTDERSPEQSGLFQLNCVEKNVINISGGKSNFAKLISNYKATFIHLIKTLIA
jgi:hypothetical protein